MRRHRDSSTSGPGGPRNRAGSASVLVGVVAVICAFVPVVGELVSAPAALLAIVLGGVGLWRCDQGRATNGGEATTGLMLGVVAGAVTALVYAATLPPPD